MKLEGSSTDDCLLGDRKGSVKVTITQCQPKQLTHLPKRQPVDIGFSDLTYTVSEGRKKREFINRSVYYSYQRVRTRNKTNLLPMSNLLLFRGEYKCSKQVLWAKLLKFTTIMLSIDVYSMFSTFLHLAVFSYSCGLLSLYWHIVLLILTVTFRVEPETCLPPGWPRRCKYKQKCRWSWPEMPFVTSYLCQVCCTMLQRPKVMYAMIQQVTWHFYNGTCWCIFSF